MRILKKSLALFLAVAMIASLVVVNVLAENEPTVTLGSARGKAGDVVTLDVTMTNNPGFISFKANYASTNEKITVTGAKNDQNTGLVPYGYQGNGSSTIGWADGTAEENCVVNGVVCRLQFQIAADATPGEYPVTLTFVSAKNAATQAVTFTAVSGTITVYEEKYINAVVAPTVDTPIEYGATVPDNFLPAKVVGTGKTSGGADILAGADNRFDVVWDQIDTFVEPGTKTVAGTVAEPTNSTEFLFKNTDYSADVDSIATTATYTVAKSTAGVVAPVAIEIQKKSDGVDTAIGALKDVAEIAAVTSTTIAIEGGATETVTLNWAAAENKTDAGNADENLNLGSDSDTLVVLVPVTGDTTYYDLTGKKAVVTINMAPAEIAGGSIVVKGQRATAIPEVTAVIPADGVAAGTYTVDVIFYSLTAEGALDAEKEKITDAAVVVTAGKATTITAKATKNLKDMGFDEVGEKFAVQVLVNNAALKVGEATFITDNVVASTGSAPAGIGTPSVPAKPQTPVEPGTEEPGTEEPGTEEPGTEEPGTEEPGTEEPGTEEPTTGFEDVTAEFDWAAESINKLAELGVINGKGDNKFAPNDDITRAEFTKMIVTLLGLEAAATETAFADCAADDWFTPYIIAATEAGVIKGVADDAFAPNDTITREQACTILGRALALVGEADVAFTDAAEISEYAAEFVAALAELGIINGYEDGSFAPANNITRAEAAKILAGALDIIAPVEEVVAE